VVIVGVHNNKCGEVMDSSALELTSDQISIWLDFGKEKAQFSRPGKEAVR